VAVAGLAGDLLWPVDARHARSKVRNAGWCLNGHAGSLLPGCRHDSTARSQESGARSQEPGGGAGYGDRRERAGVQLPGRWAANGARPVAVATPTLSSTFEGAV